MEGNEMVGLVDGADDSDDDYYHLYMWPESPGKKKPTRGGSVKGKSANKDRQREEWGERLIEDYFGENPTYSAQEFRRRFRMRRELFERIVTALVDDPESNYFVQRMDAVGKLGFRPGQKVTAAMRMMAYGTSADQLDELIRMAESTTLETLEKFCQAIIRLFGPEYLREPTEEDLQQLLEENAARGFPGMIGSLDCMHWEWKNCPTAWQGVFQGKEKTSTIVLEAVASQSLWIWHAFFGTPGANNDLNVLERSPLLHSLINGDSPNVSFKVNGATYDKAYYLTDGIYPAWAVFQQSISEPQGKKRRLFASVQEAVRKDVERAFGVLQQRFRILALPCKLWHPEAMEDVILASIILHNMIIEDERGIVSCTPAYLFEDGWVGPANMARADECPTASIARELRAIEDSGLHYVLKNDLIEHVWRLYGDSD